MLVTQVSRLTPFILAKKIKISKKIKIWLEFVPVAAISALLFQETYFENGVFLPPEKLSYIASAIITFIIGIITRNLILTVVLGIVCFYFINYFLFG